MNWHASRYGAWYRRGATGAGWSVLTPLSRPLFSERYEYKPAVFRFCGFRVFRLQSAAAAVPPNRSPYLTLRWWLRPQVFWFSWPPIVLGAALLFVVLLLQFTLLVFLGARVQPKLSPNGGADAEIGIDGE